MIPVRHLQGAQIINLPFLFPLLQPLFSSSISPKLFPESSIICSLHLNFFYSIFFLALISCSLFRSYFVIFPITFHLYFFSLYLRTPSCCILLSTPQLHPSLFSCPWRTLLPFCLVSRGSPTTPMGSEPWLSPL